MDILIPDNWLRDFLKTKATPKNIAKHISLCGPSIEKITKAVGTDVYHVEVTTNRVDAASVYGIAKEAAAILPRFRIPAKLIPLRTKTNLPLDSKVNYLEAIVDHNLCFRFSAILIKKVKIADSPLWMKEKLEAAGLRSINNIVDISNYIMLELGQPVHTFDYDKIKGAKMCLRKSKKGEVISTLDGKTHTLPGNDIVIEDGAGRLIDLAGIMGGENSAVDQDTKNVLLFIQTYNPVNIRRSVMNLAARTQAATLFEKGLDTELVTPAIHKGVDLFVKLTAGTPEKQILDIYPTPFKSRKLQLTKEFIDSSIGIQIPKSNISKMLNAFGFETLWKGNVLQVDTPSSRAGDITIGQDIVEEIARLYGYHNLPSELPEGSIPDPLAGEPFTFETKLKEIVKSLGGVEIYTSSLVSRQMAGENSLRLLNPLGKEAEFLRTQLSPSLIEAVEANDHEKDRFFLFEMANVYKPRKGDLPEEITTLGVIFKDYPYRECKGILESLLTQINSDYRFVQEDAGSFLPNQRLSIKHKGNEIGQFGILGKTIYFEFKVKDLEASQKTRKYTPIPKFPAQIEDITLTFPSKTRIGEVIKNIPNSELVDIYKDSYTFRVYYQDPKKTLTDREVEKIRDKILTKIKSRFGGVVKV